MFDNKDYTRLTLEELISEERKIRKVQVFFIVILILLICAIVYGIISNGIRSTNIFILIMFLLLVYKNAQSLKTIRAEIQNRTPM
ncbi:hypothetical protein BLX24_19360 [Arsenicibacter rosenii]|uniref:Uncharacterized protein n=1 Tax=Arsenicibacter rosenii TaxID=1750698 RepID=A0A1S2VF94_9BACT|nr:hypothetical protein BLX24_19360 [Arsenicibacter rosenii]